MTEITTENKDPQAVPEKEAEHKPLPLTESGPGAAQQKEDWWAGFKTAVANPEVSIYDYLRREILESMEVEEDCGWNGYVKKAREKALEELFGLTNSREISKKLKSLSKNKLIFDYKTRVSLQVARAVVDTYVKAKYGKEEEAKKAEEAGDLKKAAEIKKEAVDVDIDIDNEPELKQEIKEIAETLNNQDEKEVEKVIKEAAKQLEEKPNVLRAIGDGIRFLKRYFTPDNVVNIAVHALPLITWQYRWALALGLGAYTSRMAAWHGARGVYFLCRRDTDKAREEGHKAMTALKAAAGNILVIGISPAVGKLPKLMIGFVNFAVDATYSAVVETFEDMLKQEEQKPGSTPLSTKAKVQKGVLGFFKKHLDTLVGLGAKTLEKLKPSRETWFIRQVFKRSSVTKLWNLTKNIGGVAHALGIRIKRIGQMRISEIGEQLSRGISSVKTRTMAVLPFMAGGWFKSPQESEGDAPVLAEVKEVPGDVSVAVPTEKAVIENMKGAFEEAGAAKPEQATPELRQDFSAVSEDAPEGVRQSPASKLEKRNGPS